MEQQNDKSNYINHWEPLPYPFVQFYCKGCPFGSSSLRAKANSSTQVHVQSFLTFKRLWAQEFK